MGLNAKLSKKFRIDYNKQLERYYKAENFLNNANENEFNQWISEFDKIVVWLGQQINIAEKFGYEMNEKEILEGFNDIN